MRILETAGAVTAAAIDAAVDTLNTVTEPVIRHQFKLLAAAGLSLAAMNPDVAGDIAGTTVRTIQEGYSAAAAGPGQQQENTPQAGQFEGNLVFDTLSAIGGTTGTFVAHFGKSYNGP